MKIKTAWLHSDGYCVRLCIPGVTSSADDHNKQIDGDGFPFLSVYPDGMDAWAYAEKIAREEYGVETVERRECPRHHTWGDPPQGSNERRP